jgi:hypothetical protein
MKYEQRYILFIFLILIVLPTNAFSESEEAYLQTIVLQFETELKAVGYDISKLPEPQMGAPISIVTPELKKVYPQIIDLSGETDADGKFYIKEIVKMAIEASGNLIKYEYRWKNKNSIKTSQKLFVGKYLQRQK